MDFNISSIEDALAQPPETIVSIAISVLAIGPVKEYTNKANQARRYYSFTVGDATAHTTGRSYLMKQQTTFVPGKSLLLQGLVRKTGEESLWAVSSTKVVDWVSVTVPDNVRAAAASPIKQKGEVTPLAKAVISNSPCTVVGKIVQKSPLKHRRNGELPTKFIRITDATDGPCVKVALFGEDALREYKPGDVVSVSDAYKWKTSTTLSTKKSSQIEFLPSDSIAVDIQSQPLLMDDPDFDDDKKPNTEPEEFTVMGVQSAHAYQCCSYPGCRNKKLDDGTCPTCKKTDTQNKMYGNAVLVLLRGSKCSCLKLFKDELGKLFEIGESDQMFDEDFKSKLLLQLPITAKGIFTDNGLKVVSAKRKACTLQQTDDSP